MSKQDDLYEVKGIRVSLEDYQKFRNTLTFPEECFRLGPESFWKNCKSTRDHESFEVKETTRNGRKVYKISLQLDESEPTMVLD